MSSSKPYAIYLCTCSNEAEALKITTHLLENRLAAGVNMVPQVRSMYWWQGKIEKSDEWLLFIESQTALSERLIAAINELHSYEVPKIVQMPINDGLKEYLTWIDESTKGAK